jgi:hypothetical protein
MKYTMRDIESFEALLEKLHIAIPMPAEAKKHAVELENKLRLQVKIH